MTRIFQISVVLLILMGAGLPLQAQAPEVIAPNVFFRGVEFSQNTRYAATFIRPSANFLMRRISVEITLPPDAVLGEMLVSDQVNFKVIRVNQAGALTLIWQISRVEGADPFDAFAFTLAKPLTEEAEFYIEWLDEAGQKFSQNFREVPPLTVATETQGSIFPVPGAELQPVGKTGVQLASDSQESLLSVQILPNDFNPPAEYGDIWWCSLLELSGLAVGQTAEVIVPLRRPVAPFTELILFQQQADGSWLALPETGRVTADGQFVQYIHPGGLIASGGDESIQIEVLPAAEIPIETPEAATEPYWGEVASQNAPPSVEGITDGLSNTIQVGEQVGEAPPIPLTDGSVQQISDGLSNTIQIGETVGDTLFGNNTVNTDPNVTLNDGTTIFLGADVASGGNGAGSAEEQETTVVIVDDLNGLGLQISVKGSEVEQCQLGRVICTLLNRRAGTR